MFLDVLRRRNPAFIEAAIGLHQQGKLPANAYVLDLDTVAPLPSTWPARAPRIRPA
jgi:hypothetical protein